jgi:general secretion pathway protein C
MKHTFIYGLPLAVVLILFCGPYPVTGQDLGLRVVGTGVSNGPGQSLAVVENQSTGQQKTYHEGDQLGPGVIKRILYGKVVIATGTGELVLSMRSGGDAVDRPHRQEMGSLDRKEVESTLPDPEHLIQAIRFRPRFEKGKPVGFVIYGIEPDSIFQRMGLQDGDLILGVNGRSFATTQQTMEFYDALKKGGAVALQVRRDESTHEMLFEIQ